jgi:hypothetical protein
MIFDKYCALTKLDPPHQAQIGFAGKAGIG